MFSEVLHGLVGRTQRNAGVDQNQPRAALVPSPLRIGIIPAGSTDCVCFSTVGTNDAETSALHIIVGDSLPMDVSSVHHNSTLLRYSVSLLGYGFYGDIIKDSEKKRWMGLIRYDFSGLKTFLSHHCYEGMVSFLPARHTVGSPRDRKPCRAGCFVCRQSKQQLEEEQKKSLYGLENTGNVSEARSRPCAELRVFESWRTSRLPAAGLSLCRCRSAHPFLLSSRRQQMVAVCQLWGGADGRGPAVGAPARPPSPTMLCPGPSERPCHPLTREPSGLARHP